MTENEIENENQDVGNETDNDSENSDMLDLEIGEEAQVPASPQRITGSQRPQCLFENRLR